MFFLKTKCFKSDSQQERKIKQKYNTNDKVQIIREKTKTKVQQEMNLSSKGITLKWQIWWLTNVCGQDIFLPKTKFLKTTWNYLYYINCKKSTLTNQNFESGYIKPDPNISLEIKSFRTFAWLFEHFEEA